MKLMLTLILLTINSLLFAPEINQVAIVQGERIEPYAKLLHAIGTVESQNNDNAVNRKEMAFGRYQIREIRLKDYYQRTGIHFTLDEMKDSVKAKRVLLYYCRDPYDLDEIPLNWNCRSRPYLMKVKRELTKL
jgi:hypothetical protein